MKGVEDFLRARILGTTWSFIIYFFYSGDERHISVLMFLVLFSRMGKLDLHWCLSVFSYRKSHLTKKEPRRRQTRESTVSFAILSQNFLTLVNWAIFQISPATLNKAIKKAKGKIKNYNRNWGRGGQGVHFYYFFYPAPSTRVYNIWWFQIDWFIDSFRPLLEWHIPVWNRKSTTLNYKTT